MRFEGEFRIAGQPEQVLSAFEDVERMVKCMPGAGIEGRDQDGNYLGSMLVVFGPKKIRFKGKVRSTVDPAAGRGSLHVRGAADMRTVAPAEVHVDYTVRPDPAAAEPTSIVSLVSEAELGGVLADFAQTGGIAVTRALMEIFAERLAEEFSREQPARSAEVVGETIAPAPRGAMAAPAEEARPALAALPAGRLIWRVLKGRLLVLTSWMRRRLRLRS